MAKRPLSSCGARVLTYIASAGALLITQTTQAPKSSSRERAGSVVHAHLGHEAFRRQQERIWPRLSSAACSNWPCGKTASLSQQSVADGGACAGLSLCLQSFGSSDTLVFQLWMMDRNIFLVFFLINLGLDESVASPKEIHLAGIFPINGVEGWQGGQVSSIGAGIFPIAYQIRYIIHFSLVKACEPAAKLALHDVNDKVDLLPGYTLRYDQEYISDTL